MHGIHLSIHRSNLTGISLRVTNFEQTTKNICISVGVYILESHAIPHEVIITNIYLRV